MSCNLQEDDVKAIQNDATDNDETPIIINEEERTSAYRRHCDCCKPTCVDWSIDSGFLCSLAVLMVSAIQC